MTLDPQEVAILLETCDTVAMSILPLPHRDVTLGELLPLPETTVTILLVHLLCDVTMMTIECEALHLLRRLLLALTTGPATTHRKKGHPGIPPATAFHHLYLVTHTTATTGALRLPATDTLATLRVLLLLDLEAQSVVPFLEDATILKDLAIILHLTHVVAL